MRCTMLFYTLCLYFRLLELLPTGSSEVRRIIGGESADEDKYQYVVRLQYQIIFFEKNIIHILKHLHSCTAAVLTPIWSLTAAHCFLEKGSLDIQVKNVTLRPVVIYGPHERRTTCKVTMIIRHPAFKLRMFDIANDIALIRHEPITLEEYARVSGLDYVTMVGQKVILTGYGITNATAMFEIARQKLYEITSDATTLGMPLQVLDAVVVYCGKDYGNQRNLLKGGMCLARPCGVMSGLCPGDSGGPLLHQSGVVGVNSLGSDEGRFCFLKPHSAFFDPAVVTPTSPYIDWISRTIGNEVKTQT